MIYLNPGDKVWYAFPEGLIVQATVLTCEDIHTNGDKPALMAYYQADGTMEVSVPTVQKGENGWTIYDMQGAEALQGHRRVNQFLWIDEPVGHSIQLGDECFLTLTEALAAIRPSNGRHLKRRLKAARNAVYKFIVHTWKLSGQKHPGFSRKLPFKQVYVVRSR